MSSTTRTASITKGRGNAKHNTRTQERTPQNIDTARTEENKTLIHRDIRQAYHEIFQPAVDAYNAKQKRKDRKIKDYYAKACKDKKIKPFHELVIQVGNKNDEKIPVSVTNSIYTSFLTEFQKNNPRLHVIGAYIHNDEATPHMHLDYIPVAEGGKKGLSLKVSNDAAIRQQGFSGWEEWRNAQFDLLEQIMLDHGIERDRIGNTAQHIADIEVYRQAAKKAEKELQPLVEVKKQALTEIINSVDVPKKPEKGILGYKTQNVDSYIAEAEKTITELSRAVSGLPAIMDSLDFEKKQLEQEQQAVKTDKSKAQKTQTRADLELKDALQKSETAEILMNIAQQKAQKIIQTAQDQAEQIQDQLDQRSEQLDLRSVQLDQRERDLDHEVEQEVEKQFSILKDQLDQKSKQLDNREQNINYEIQKRFQKKDIRLRSLEIQIEHLESDRSSTQTLVNDLRTEIDNLRTENDKNARLKSRFAQRVCNQAKEIEELKSELSEEKEKSKNLSEQFKEEREEFKNKISVLEKNFEAEIQKLKNEISFWKEKLHDAFIKLTKIVKAVGLLKYDKEIYPIRDITKRQSWLIDGLANYGAEQARDAGYEDLAAEMEKRVDLDKEISKHIDVLRKKDRNQNHDLER